MARHPGRKLGIERSQRGLEGGGPVGGHWCVRVEGCAQVGDRYDGDACFCAMGGLKRPWASGGGGTQE